MATYDRKFAVIQPTLDRLVRKPLEASDVGLLNPQGTSPVPLIDGELVQITSTYKWNRGSDTSKPAFFTIEDRGDYGVQASRKMSVIIGGGNFEFDTIVYDTGLLTLGGKVEGGTVNNSLSGSVARWGLVAQSSGIILGYVMRLAAVNHGLLRVLSVFA